MRKIQLNPIHLKTPKNRHFHVFSYMLQSLTQNTMDAFDNKQ